MTNGSNTPAAHNSRLSRGQKEGGSTTFMTQPPAATLSKKSLGKKSTQEYGLADPDAEHLN